MTGVQSPPVVTALVIPVREAETLVRQRALQVTPELLPRDRGVAAHVTLLAPFMDPGRVDEGVVAELERFFGDVTAFGFELTAVCEFPGGAAYLSPEPAALFRRLTQGLHHLFPEFPPYGGQFDEVVPHLSVPLAPGENTESLRTDLTARLPIEAHATEATLVAVVPEDTHTLATFGFGTTAA